MPDKEAIIILGVCTVGAYFLLGMEAAIAAFFTAIISTGRAMMHRDLAR